MGGDGGCHPNGRKYMQGTMEKTREDKEREAPPDRREQLLIRTRTCSLSNETLEVGVRVVADEIGNLFSKETLLTSLIEKNLPPEYQHIRGMRDVVELNFHLNPDAPTEGNDVDWSTDNWSPYSCPIANVEMNGRYPFVVIRTKKTAHSSANIAGSGGGGSANSSRVNVISEKGLKQVGIEALQAEYGPFEVTDVIKLVPNETERFLMIQELNSKRLEEKTLKKKKKNDKRKEIQSIKEECKSQEVKSSKIPKISKTTQKHPKPSIGSQSSKNFFGAVISETEKSLETYEKSNNTFKGMFHGAGSQKPSSATQQFILESGKRGNLG